MRKVIAGLFMSLDGVVEAPEHWGFQFATDELWELITAQIAEADAVLLGRHTYEEFAELWPNQPSDVPMSDFLNSSPKYVVSSTRGALPWGPATLIEGDVPEEITRLKQQPGKNIQVPGSPTLVRSLLRDGLLDELSLSICPIVVGDGMRLFDEVPSQTRLELVESRRYDTGAVGLTYRPAPPAASQTE